MSITKEFDTITAISTPLGEGAIGIVRLSGTDAIAIANKVFKGKNLETVASHTINYGHIVENEETIDEVMVSVMRAPKTFTREDVVEINTHGGVAVTNEILQLLIRSGARMAEPGEFTKRAFLNGRVDLTQAEAVMDLIRAKTDKAMAVAVSQLDGSLKNLINNTRQEILNTLAQVEVNIDYPEYDMDDLTSQEMKKKAQEVSKQIEQLLQTAQEGKIIRNGLATAIVGRPNVGKSTLMNHLIGQKIAITSNKPQTTRNRIQTVYTDMERGQIVFLDTPGIHKAKNKLGEYMVNTAEHTLNEVDVILWLVEPSNFIGAGEQHIIEQLKKTKTPVILVINKVDTVSRDKILEFIDTYRKVYDFAEIVPASALRAQNLDTVLDMIFKYLPYGPQFYDEDTITDQPERAIVAEIIREKALHALDDEIPHGIAVCIDRMKQRKGQNIMDIEATIVCERDSHKGIVIGKGGAMLKKIGSNARYEIERLLEEQVNLKLWVKVKKDWRDSDSMMKNFGYNKDEI